MLPVTIRPPTVRIYLNSQYVFNSPLSAHLVRVVRDIDVKILVKVPDPDNSESLNDDSHEVPNMKLNRLPTIIEKQTSLKNTIIATTFDQWTPDDEPYDSELPNIIQKRFIWTLPQIKY
ncbi:unnamed protein product [Rotaria socialis]|uniref:Uncharacterized protein n=2 Tax=Rotaria socialis TaxID=392032 RepID=A0A821PSH8_9BILA|nr:unnamed protein product [Rotaria socialis]CAF3575307.1 unnamed protein product [Rotaria socialis]CAF3704978.1 unnamed protein product [Rotaria socialis]CAF4457352.1 unnamed protein product [Rotaria socialis]CAF4810246.1 unnamed protein product [Rotaria socialis]